MDLEHKYSDSCLDTQRKMLNCKNSDRWLQLNRHWLILSAILMLFALNHFQSVDGYSLQKHFSSRVREYTSCPPCRNYFNEVLSRLPHRLEDSDDSRSFGAIIEEVCQEPEFRRSFAKACKNLTMYSSSYYGWLLIRNHAEYSDKPQAMCHINNLCFHQQLPKWFVGESGDHRRRPQRPTADNSGRKASDDRIIEYGEQNSRAFSTNEAYASASRTAFADRLARLQRAIHDLMTESRNEVDLN